MDPVLVQDAVDRLLFGLLGMAKYSTGKLYPGEYDPSAKSFMLAKSGNSLRA